MSRGAPFLLVPWREDFLSALTARALEDTEGRLERAAFLFPHARPMRYLHLLLRDAPGRFRGLAKPLLMPRMHTLSGLFSALAALALSRPARQAGQLDRVALLLGCVRAEAEEQPSQPFRPFRLDAPSFFPWGLRLDALFEECLVQCREPRNFLHAEDSVSPYAAMLLSRLGGIFARYTRALLDREWTTPGLDAWLAARHLEEKGLPEALFPASGPGSVLYIAGFHLLSGAEERLFKAAWSRGRATLVIHADPALAEKPEASHWSCEAFARRARDWGAAFELLPAPSHADPASSLASPGPFPPPEKGAARRLSPRFVAAYDLHSQLARLREELTARPASGGGAGPGQSPSGQNPPEDFRSTGHLADTAVILPAGDLLLPVLHHLPDKEANISMGYPLARSPLFRLLDALGRLQEGRKDQAYYWRDLVDLFRHPYVKMLHPEAGEADAPEKNGENRALALRRLLHALEQNLRRRGRAYAEPWALLEELAATEDLTPEQRAAALFLSRLFRHCFTAFEAARNTRELAAALEGLCVLLISHGQGLWERFPIDAECLYRLRQSVIPELAAVEFGDEAFPPARLFAMLRELLQAQRVPFEAEPLVGLQVLGMLESRLLSFRRVIVVDAGEERLPGSPSGDPLLPEALRPELGLPPLAAREQAVAHTFFRLLHGADEVLLLWSESAEAPGIQDMKSGRSRFVQELLWQEEKRAGRLFARQGRDGPLEVLAAAVSPMRRRDKCVRVTGAVRDLLDDLATRPLSASLLDSYLQCPVRFFYERLLDLAPADEVGEGEDPLAVGDLLHHCLERTYAGLLRRPLPGGEELAALLDEELAGNFFNTPAFAALEARLPADHAAMLREAGKKRLHDYLLRQPPTTVLATELTLNAVFAAHGREFRLTGKADRIDARPSGRGPEESSGRVSDESLGSPPGGSGLVVVDYKSGRVPDFSAALWKDEGFWRSVAGLRPRLRQDGEDFLHGMASRLPGVQLPLYLLLCSQNPGSGGLPALPPLNALWVALGADGGEKPLLPETLPPEVREKALHEHIPALIGGLLRHLFESEYFCPRRGPHCDWCSRQKSCMEIDGP